MRFARAILACLAAVAVGAVLVSGGSGSDPRTPAALPGLPPPFLGTAVTGDGGATAAIDAYGDVVDLRPGPAGAALIDNASARQAAGTVAADTGIVPRVRIGGGPALPLWRAESMTQRYLPGTNVVRTVARLEGARVVVVAAAAGESLAMEVVTRSGDAGRAVPALSIDVEDGAHCERAERAGRLDLLCRPDRPGPPVAEGGSRALSRRCDRVVREAVEEGRRWLAGSTPLGATPRPTDARPAPAGTSAADPRGPSVPPTTPPRWARAMYERSLLTVHALTSRATGAVAAGARDGWAYVWPRDAATAALALKASGHPAEGRRVAAFLTGLDLAAAARFTEAGAPVSGRPAQGDAAGWVTVAANATGLRPPTPLPWKNRADYQESTPGTYLANALAVTAVDGPKTPDILEFSAHQPRAAAEAARIAREFGTPRGLLRSAGDPASGLDSAAAWAVRPFALRPLYPAAATTLLRLVRHGTPFGITPGEGWTGGNDPWTAPTAWTAWSLAALAKEVSRDASGPRRPGALPTSPSPRQLHEAALVLLTDLRRAATPSGALPERVDIRSGVPTSTTPLLWSSAFTVLALRELWP